MENLYHVRTYGEEGLKNGAAKNANVFCEWPLITNAFLAIMLCVKILCSFKAGLVCEGIKSSF